jgi:hypothetical protein
MEQFGELPKEDRVQRDLALLTEHWRRFTAAGYNENSLTKALFRVFRTQFTVLFFINTFTAALDFAAPFLVLALVNFIEDGNTG